MEKNYFLAKWLHGEITDEELKNLVGEDEFITYKKIAAVSKTLETPKINKEKALENIKKTHYKSKVKKINFLNISYKVAAILAIFVIAYYFNNSKTTTYTTQLAEKTNFELPDNSKVNLNAASEVSFKPNDWKKNRALNLKGEAYFEVKKGSKFTVNTNLGSVSVLGTHFNVIARDSYFEVVCFEGLVSVEHNHKITKVPAGSRLKVLNSTIDFSNKITAANPSWLKNKSDFNSMPYKFVINELERQYNLKIEYDSKYDNELFTGTFTHSDLNLALQAISIPLNLKFTIFSDKKVSLHR